MELINSTFHVLRAAPGRDKITRERPWTPWDCPAVEELDTSTVLKLELLDALVSRDLGESYGFVSDTGFTMGPTYSGAVGGTCPSPRL